MFGDKICRTSLWNSSVSWETDHPTVSECFQNLILVIASCAVLWIIAPFEFVKIFKTRINPLPWTKLSIVKLTFKVVLLLICTMKLATALTSYINNYPEYGLDELIASVSFFLTIVLTMILTILCKSRGIRVSLALPSFWMLSTMTTLLSIYNAIQILDTEDWITVTNLVNDILTFIVSLMQLVMSTIPDKALDSRGRESKVNCPLEGSPLPSRLTFGWIINLLRKSVENSLHQDHLIPLCSDIKSSSVAKEFEQACTTNSRSKSRLSQDPENLLGSLIDEVSQEENTESHSSYPKGKSLFLTLLKTSRKSMAITSVLEIIYTILYFLPVYILSLIIDETNKSKDWHNYVYSAALFLSLLLSSFSNSQRKYFGLTGALRIKTAVINAVFTKAIKVGQNSESARNLITVDADNIFQGMCIMSEVWGSPIRLLIGIYILWSFIGPSCFVGILTAFLLIPINVITQNGVAYFQQKAELKKSEKIELLSECLLGMKALKLYAWEEFLLDKLIKLRNIELGKLRTATFLRMAFKFIFISSTSMVTLTTISAYVLMENSVDVKTMLVSYFIIYLLKTPFQSLLHLMAYFIEGFASVKKVQSFLEAKELEKTQILNYAEENSVILTNASFSWNESDAPCLKNLSVHIPRGSLIAVVGGTGSGKSSLLRAILGEMHRKEGESSVKGPLAFVGGKPWIQNMTMEKNILFLRNKEDEFYHKTLEACALTVDIESLPAGDETEIGEKGIHLSPDQKLKVDLARAVYQDADLYIFDDPLKNLNMLSAEHIYHRVIGRSGILKEKTRVFMTSTEEFLPLVDCILFLKEGRIVEQGTYSQLTEKNGHFSEYLKTDQRTPTVVKEKRSFDSELKHDKKKDNFGKQNDLWCSTVVAPAKIELESSSANESSTSPKGLGSKLTDYLKINGYISTAVIILLAVLASFSEVTSGVWLSEWTDEEGDDAKSKNNLLIYAGFVLSHIFLTVTCGIVLFTSSTMAAGKLHTWLLQQIMRASQLIFETTPTEKIIKSFDVDFHYVDERIPDTVYAWLFTVLKIPALLVIVFVVSPFLAVGLIPLVYLFFVIQRLYQTSWQQLQHLTAATSCPLSNLLEDTLRGISHIRTSDATSHFYNRFHLKMDTHNNCFFLFHIVSRWLSCVLEITTALLVLITAASAFNAQNLGVGLVALSIIYAVQLGETLTTVIYTSSLLSIDLTPFERIMSFSQMKQESEWEDPAARPPESWPDSGSVFVQNLSTAYGEGMHPVIHDINLSIKPGEKIAIVGKEESGIYTFLYSLFRLIEPVEGNIIIDNIDISKLGLRDLRSKLAIIQQETIVFKSTVKQNLDPGNLYTDDELTLAMETVNLSSQTSFTSLDCVVDEQISLEEKYLLSIARCLLKKPKIVVIDEQDHPNFSGRKLFQDSTILSFSQQPLEDHDGRTIRFISGEIGPEDFPSSSQQI